MASVHDRCEMGHSPCCPAKEQARQWWLERCNRAGDIITISHGALLMLNALKWEGWILVSDIDPVVRNKTDSMRRKRMFPAISSRMMPPAGEVFQAVRSYCKKYTAKDLVAVDLDLTATVDGVAPVVRRVSLALAIADYCGKLIVTFRNGRDGFASTKARVDRLTAQVAGCGFQIKEVQNHTYTSQIIGEHTEISRGSAMCVVELTVQSTLTDRQSKDCANSMLISLFG